MSSNGVVLITGAAGRLGRKLIQSLKNRYLVRGVDIIPFEDGFEYVKADITNFKSIQKVVENVDTIVHLAAIIPPLSEKDEDGTMRVNVEGTKNILKAIEGVGRNVQFIFASSVAVYGVNERDCVPITVDHELRATDIYSKSKIVSESLIRNSKVDYTILRISGIYAPDRIELPERLQFQRIQKVEFVYLDDVVKALKSSIERPEARHRVFNIAGGPSWRMRGEEFIKRMYGALGLEIEANYSPVRTYFGWYDTSASNRILDYQHTSFTDFVGKLREMGKKLGFL